MRHQGGNAAQIVEALSEHPAIERIHYPSHFEEPEQRRIFEAQCDHPGAVSSLELSGGKKPAFDFLRSLSNSVSLGGMESLARHPATTTAVVVAGWRASDSIPPRLTELLKLLKKSKAGFLPPDNSREETAPGWSHCASKMRRCSGSSKWDG